MDANTARNAAIGCFGLAAILGLLSVTGAFESKPKPEMKPRCIYAPLPKKEDRALQVEDWCFSVFAGETLHLKIPWAFEMGVTGGAEVIVALYDGQDRMIDTYVVTPGKCFNITKQWNRLEITSPHSTSTVRVRPVGPKYPDRLSSC